METAKILSIVMAILSVIICLSVAYKTNLLKASNSNDSPYSFSRFQLWLWTTIIVPAFILHWGFSNPNEASINDPSLVLLGISLGTTVTAQVVHASLLASGNLPMKGKGLVSKQFIVDLLMDDQGQFSIGRLQNLLFTILYVVIYVYSFFGNKMQLPYFDTTAYTLMGISTGGFILGKSTGK